MKKHTILFGLLITLGAGCQNTKQSVPESPTEVISDTSAQKVYCSPDNKLTDHQSKQSFKSYCLVSVSTEPLVSGKPQNFSFTILNNFGETVKNFEVVHEKLMHMILVNKNLDGFQHLHPEYDSVTGVFTVKDITFPNDGQYMIYLDFVAQAGGENPDKMVPQMIAEKLVVGNKTNTPVQKLTLDITDTNDTIIKNVDNYKVTLSSHEQNLNQLTRSTQNKLRFIVDDIEGKKINPLEKYLGTYGHLVIIHEETHQYIHAHPLETGASNSMEFDVAFPLEGTYKLFFQFQHDGTVHRTEYGVSVGTGAGIPLPKEAMDHSNH